MENNNLKKEDLIVLNYEEKIINSIDGYNLCVRFYDTKNPKGVVKIIHGMQEHQGRYEEFATYLQENGYAVVTSDMRGHGKNAPKLSHIAKRKGHKLIIEDEKVILEALKERYKDVPVILLGHSMGTIIARRVLQLISSEYSKVVLSGYPNPSIGARIGMILARYAAIFRGGDKYSKLLNNLVLGPFEKAIKDADSKLDWLSYNKDNVKKYEQDPLCGVDFTIGSYRALFNLLNSMSRPWRYRSVKIDLPIYLISGEDDPCTGGVSGRKASLKTLKVAGFNNLKVDTIKQMRHEILNETDKKMVYKMILDFLNN